MQRCPGRVLFLESHDVVFKKLESIEEETRWGRNCQLSPHNYRDIFNQLEWNIPYRIARCFSILLRRSSRPGCRSDVRSSWLCPKPTLVCIRESEPLAFCFPFAFEGSSILTVLLRGPSSFFAMSYFICTSRSRAFASTRAQEGISATEELASLLGCRFFSAGVYTNSARLDVSFRALFWAKNDDIDLLI